MGRAPGRHPGLRHGRDRGSASDRESGVRSQGQGTGDRRQETGAGNQEEDQLPASSFLATDISADLPELAQTPILVVCAGAKAILDLPATLEWLETHGVTVVGYGTDRFPAFYNRDSGLPVDVRADTPAEVAALFRAQRALGLPCGMLVTVPIPAEFEPPADQMEAAIAQALAEAEAEGIKGKADDAVPAGPRQRADGGSQPAGEPGAAGEQRSGGGGDCGGVGWKLEAGSWKLVTDGRPDPCGLPTSTLALRVVQLPASIVVQIIFWSRGFSRWRLLPRETG